MSDTAATKDDDRRSARFALCVLGIVESVLAMAQQAAALRSTSALGASDTAAVIAAVTQALAAGPVLNDLPPQHQQAGSAVTAGLRTICDELRVLAG